MPDPDPATGTMAAFPSAAVAVAPACRSCSFWLEAPHRAAAANLKAPAMGLCRRNPPALHVLGFRVDRSGRAIMGTDGQPIPNLQTLRPATEEHDYCGEWNLRMAREKK